MAGDVIVNRPASPHKRPAVHLLCTIHHVCCLPTKCTRNMQAVDASWSLDTAASVFNAQMHTLDCFPRSKHDACEAVCQDTANTAREDI